MKGGASLLRDLLREWVLEKQVPRGIGFGRALGTALLVLLVVQAATGMLLGLCYAPTPDHAWDTVKYIDSIPGGRLVRGLHHFGSSAIVVLLGAHLARVFFTAAYKAPRQLLWCVGLLLLVVVLGFGFTGYLLPWDQKAYWATAVGLGIVKSVPVAGPPLAGLLLGGEEVGALTLTRMYALHVLVLPALLVLLTGVHLLLVHRQGITPPGVRVGDAEQKSAPFFPDHVLRELLVAACALLVVTVLAAALGPPLMARADADQGGFVPRPEWYFLGLFELLKYVPVERAALGGVLVGAGLFFLPYLDRNPARRAAERPLLVGLGLATLGVLAVLTVRGALDAGTPAGGAPEEPVVESPGETAGGGGGEEGGILTKEVGTEAAGEVAAGRGLVDEYECLNCHTLGGEGDFMGGGGPALEEVAQGRTAEWLQAFLEDPRSEYPDTEMPSARDLDMPAGDRDVIVTFLLELGSRAESDPEKRDGTP